jgi:hypothetical protein
MLSMWKLQIVGKFLRPSSLYQYPHLLPVQKASRNFADLYLPEYNHLVIVGLLLLFLRQTVIENSLRFLIILLPPKVLHFLQLRRNFLGSQYKLPRPALLWQKQKARF